MVQKIAIFAAGLLISMTGILTASAETSTTAWVGSDESRARIFLADDAQGDKYLVLHIKLAKGWKTYWRNAGDAGAPPQLDLKGSKNLKRLSANWPAPKRFHAFGFDSFGFDEKLVLPYKIQFDDIEKPTTIALQINYLVCSHICLPQNATLNLNSHPSVVGKGSDRKILDASLAKVPKENGKAPINVSNVVVEKTPNGEQLTVTAHTKTLFGMPDIMVESIPGFTFSRPVPVFSRDRKTVRLTVKARYRADNPPSLIGKKLRITIVDDTENVDYQTTAAAGS